MILEGGEFVTVSGVACKFPFHWKGADHMGCTWVDAIGRPWCEDVNGRRANCDMDVCEGIPVKSPYNSNVMFSGAVRWLCDVTLCPLCLPLQLLGSDTH